MSFLHQLQLSVGRRKRRTAHDVYLVGEVPSAPRRGVVVSGDTNTRRTNAVAGLITDTAGTCIKRDYPGQTLLDYLTTPGPVVTVGAERGPVFEVDTDLGPIVVDMSGDYGREAKRPGWRSPEGHTLEEDKFWHPWRHPPEGVSVGQRYQRVTLPPYAQPLDGGLDRFGRASRARQLSTGWTFCEVDACYECWFDRVLGVWDCVALVPYLYQPYYIAVPWRHRGRRRRRRHKHPFFRRKLRGNVRVVSGVYPNIRIVGPRGGRGGRGGRRRR